MDQNEWCFTFKQICAENNLCPSNNLTRNHVLPSNAFPMTRGPWDSWRVLSSGGQDPKGFRQTWRHPDILGGCFRCQRPEPKKKLPSFGSNISYLIASLKIIFRTSQGGICEFSGEYCRFILVTCSWDPIEVKENVFSCPYLPLSVGRIFGRGILEFCISLTSGLGHHDLHVYIFIANQKVMLNQGATQFCLAWQGFLGARVCFFWWSRLSSLVYAFCTYLICVYVLQNANPPKMLLKLRIGNYRSLPSSCLHGSILASGSKKHILICKFVQNIFLCTFIIPFIVILTRPPSP